MTRKYFTYACNLSNIYFITSITKECYIGITARNEQISTVINNIYDIQVT